MSSRIVVVGVDVDDEIGEGVMTESLTVFRFFVGGALWWLFPFVRLAPLW